MLVIGTIGGSNPGSVDLFVEGQQLAVAMLVVTHDPRNTSLGQACYTKSQRHG